MTEIKIHDGTRLDDWMSSSVVGSERTDHPGHDLRWIRVLRDGLGHQPYCLEAVDNGRTVGILPLAFVRSMLFGRFLVSLSYINTSGVRAETGEIARALVDQAVALADQLQVKYLELRHEEEHDHPSLTESVSSKVHMRLALPESEEELWTAFKASVRNQIRKGQKHEFSVAWGGQELLDNFYHVFSCNMRALGTPVFGRRLFDSMIRHFEGDAEFCVVRLENRPVGVAVLVHGRTVTEVPSASTLREFNSTNANMFMYWELLKRAIERGQETFDFGRSTEGSGPHRFKKQWGAEPQQAVWQYYVRNGDVASLRRENNKYGLAIRMWQRLPVSVTRVLGPPIVRGIP